MSRLRLLGGVFERLHLALAPDELGQPAPCRTLQSRPQRPEAGHLINIDRLADAFDSGWTQRLQDKIAFTQFSDLLSRCDGTDWRQQLNSRGQVRRMPNRSVLCLSRAGCDRTHHNLASIRSDPRLQW